ncbi:putrescine aminopropyltransferase, partial [Coemansia sp. RSA 455]
DKTTNFKVPLRRMSPEQELKLFKYYNADIHRAAFVLPNFTRLAIGDIDQSAGAPAAATTAATTTNTGATAAKPDESS